MRRLGNIESGRLWELDSIFTMQILDLASVGGLEIFDGRVTLATSFFFELGAVFVEDGLGRMGGRKRAADVVDLSPSALVLGLGLMAEGVAGDVSQGGGAEGSHCCGGGEREGRGPRRGGTVVVEEQRKRTRFGQICVVIEGVAEVLGAAG
jgi:hypothetical protein